MASGYGYGTPPPHERGLCGAVCRAQPGNVFGQGLDGNASEVAYGHGFEGARADELEAGGSADPQSAGGLFNGEQNDARFVGGTATGELGDVGGHCVLLVRT